MKKLTSLQLIFCALITFSSAHAIAGATNADGTTTGTNSATTDSTTAATPIVDDSEMSTQNSTAMGSSSMDDLDDDEGGYGWIGLIGLVGLAGLMKRDRVDHTKTITR